MKKIISLILAAAAILTMAVFANAASANQITVEQAKSELEFDNGRYEYDIEFRTDRFNEYDYTIDAENGNILKFEHDIEKSYAFDFDYILSLIIRFFENLFRQAV